MLLLIAYGRSLASISPRIFLGVRYSLASFKHEMGYFSTSLVLTKSSTISWGSIEMAHFDLISFLFWDAKFKMSCFWLPVRDADSASEYESS